MWTAAILQRDNITVKNTHKCDNNVMFISGFVRQGSFDILILDIDFLFLMKWQNKLN